MLEQLKTPYDIALWMDDKQCTLVSCYQGECSWLSPRRPIKLAKGAT